MERDDVEGVVMAKAAAANALTTKYSSTQLLPDDVERCLLSVYIVMAYIVMAYT